MYFKQEKTTEDVKQGMLGGISYGSSGVCSNVATFYFPNLVLIPPFLQLFCNSSYFELSPCLLPSHLFPVSWGKKLKKKKKKSKLMRMMYQI